MFLSVSQDLEVKLGNLSGEYTQLSKLEHIIGCGNYRKDIGFLNDGSYYYPSDKQTLRFKMENDEKLIQIEKELSVPISAFTSPSSKYIVIHADEKACIYSLESFQKISECNLKRRMYPICMTEDDQYMVVRNENYDIDKNSIYIWDVHMNKLYNNYPGRIV